MNSGNSADNWKLLTRRILPVPPFFWVLKKVHWSDTDAAGIVWFPNFFGWFEDAEEEIYVAALGRTRQALLDEHAFAMPRVDATAKYRSPVRAGELIRIGIASTLENPRRLRHDFEMRAEPAASCSPKASCASPAWTRPPSARATCRPRLCSLSRRCRSPPNGSGPGRPTFPGCRKLVTL